MLVLTLDREVCAIVVSVFLFVAYLFQSFVLDQVYLGILSPLSCRLDAERMQKQHWRVSTVLYIFVRILSVHSTLSIVIDLKVELGSVFWNIVQYVNDVFLPCGALLTETYIATYSASTICEWEVDSCCHNIDCSSLK